MTIYIFFDNLSNKIFSFNIYYQFQNCAALMEDLNNIRMNLRMVMYVETGTLVLQFVLQDATKVPKHIACEMVSLVVLKLERSVPSRFASLLTHTLISTDELQNTTDMEMSVATGRPNGCVPKDADIMLTITAQTKRIILHAKLKQHLMPFYLNCTEKF